MYVCICKGITDHQIRQAVDEGASSFQQVRNTLGVASKCGSCEELARSIVDEALTKTSHTFDYNLCYAAG